MSDISDSIAANALKPAAITVDGQSVTTRSAADQIAADKYLANKVAGGHPVFSLVRAKVVIPRSV